MIRGFVNVLAGCPPVFDCLRWILEWGYRGHKRIIRDDILSYQGRVLDFGCGTGIYAKFFKQSEYVGVDVNGKYIKAARLKFPGYQFIEMDGCCLVFPDGSFDRCFVSGVFHHLDDTISDRVLSEIKRVLKPGGLLVVWEDIRARSSFNFIGDVIHRLDEGQFIREPETYRRIFQKHFALEKEYGMQSGFMDYQVFLFKKITRKVVANVS